MRVNYKYSSQSCVRVSTGDRHSHIAGDGDCLSAENSSSSKNLLTSLHLKTGKEIATGSHTLYFPKRSRSSHYTVSKVKNPLFQVLSILGILSSILWLEVVKINGLGMGGKIGILSLMTFASIWYLHKIVVQESLIAVSSLGLQITSMNTFGMRIGRKFIPQNKVKAIVINETIKEHRVISYLTVLLRDPQNPNSHNVTNFPIFENTLPRLPTLVRLYKELNRTMLPE